MAVTVELTKGKNFGVFVSSAGLLLPAMQVGCAGGLVALATVLSKEVVDLYSLIKEKKWEEAIELQNRLIHIDLEIMTALGPRGLKAAMKLKGYEPGFLRRPLQELSEEENNKVKELFKKYGFL